jgi:N-acetyl-gamma-glutamyl-phosphate reductase
MFMPSCPGEVTVIRCAVVGATGYAGAELVGALAQHPEADLLHVQGDRSAGERWERLNRRGGHLFLGEVEPLDTQRLLGLDVVFLALPQGASPALAAALHRRVGLVVDLSGDLRFPDAAAHESWHGTPHERPELLGRAVYGLPELFGADLPGADLVACAGCYATVAQIAAAPALGLGERVGARVVVTAASGTTGAGRSADALLTFSEADGDLRAYRVGRHAHAPEIARGLSRRSGRDVSVTFVPHVAPLRRGILATVVLANPGGVSEGELRAAYERTYSTAAFARVLPAGELPRVADVAHGPFCDLGLTVDQLSGDLVVVGALDNLMKGAATQAVQIMNLVLGLPETLGLLPETRTAEALRG